MSEIQELVRKLAQARQMTEIAESAMRWTQGQIAETDLGLKLAEEKDIFLRSKADEAEARSNLELAVLGQFDGNKHPHPAITVRESTKFDYDAKIAREWADEHLRAALVLDTKKFEKAIAVTEVPDFVTVRTEKSVAVSTDLSAYVE